MIGRKQKAGKDDQKKEGNKKRLPLLMILFVILGVGLAFGVMKFFNPFAKESAAQPKPHEKSMETLDLGDKVLNLADQDQSRYLRVRITLEYPKVLSEEIKAKQPLLTEKAITVFRSKKAEDILPVDKQEKVKEELLSAINSEIQKGKVEQVYLTDFLVQ